MKPLLVRAVLRVVRADSGEEHRQEAASKRPHHRTTKTARARPQARAREDTTDGQDGIRVP